MKGSRSGNISISSANLIKSLQHKFELTLVECQMAFVLQLIATNSVVLDFLDAEQRTPKRRHS
jgi:hypothetical protein